MKFYRVALGVVATLSFLLLGGAGDLWGGASPNKVYKLEIPFGDGTTDDQFGYSLAFDFIDGVVGAPLHDNERGAIYIFEYDGDGWPYQERVQAPFPAAYDQFGYSVAIDNDNIIIGAPYRGDDDAGVVYILKRVLGNWSVWDSLQASDASSDDWFGISVAIDGNYIVVGSMCCNNFEGAAYVFRGPVWTQVAKLTASNPLESAYLGISVDIDDDVVVVGASQDTVLSSRTGCAYIYEKSPVWIDDTETTKLRATDGGVYHNFGQSVSISGKYVVVGAPNADGVVAGSGAAYVFKKVGVSWAGETTEIAKITPSEGAADDWFGYSVSIDDRWVAVGAPQAENNLGGNSGTMFVFERWADDWWNETKLRAPDGHAGDRFGSAVDITTWYAASGATIGDSEECGINMGAAYVVEAPYYDDRYFAHLTDLHVQDGDNVDNYNSSNRWKKEFQEILDLRPPPDFVVVSGDLADWGVGSKGWKNTQALVESGLFHINSETGVHYLYDSTHQMRVFFSPGNHDYRGWKYFPPWYQPSSYLDLIYGDMYYHDIIAGRYAVFSLDAHWDVYKDAWPDPPEGYGIVDEYLQQFELDLDSLDGNPGNKKDTSDYVKVVFMHHPHDGRHKFPIEDNGEFILNNSNFKSLLKRYDVDYAMYGHMHDVESWTYGDTKCYITDAAEDGRHRRVSTSSTNQWDIVGRSWSVLNVTYLGDVETYGLDGAEPPNRTGLHYGATDTLLQQDIENSKYYVYEFFNEYDQTPGYISKVSVLKADTMDYDFFAEARSDGFMSITVEEKNVDGSRREVVFKNIPMYHNASYDPAGSIAHLNADASVVGYTLMIDDPEGGYREIRPETQWVVRDIDLFQDTFPIDGSSVGTGRVDAALDIAPAGSPEIMPGDSVVVTVFDPAEGLLDPEPIIGSGAAVYLYLSRDPAGKPMPTDGFIDPSGRWPFVRTGSYGGKTWYMIQMDSCFTEESGPRTGPVPDKFCVDLNDDFFAAGDTLWFFFGAANAALPSSEWSYWSQDCGQVATANEACAAAMEMQILPGAGPARGGDVLFVDNCGTKESRKQFEWAFDMMGIADLVDWFDKRDPTMYAGNSLGGHVTYVDSQLVRKYRKIIWSAGGMLVGTVGDGTGNPEKADDFAVLHEFIDLHSSGAGAGVYLSGNNIAEEWDALTGQPAADFRTTYMPFNLESGNHADEFGHSPLVIGEAGGIFDAGPPLEVDTIVAYTGYDGVRDFDKISPSGSSTLQMTYQGTADPADGAVVASELTNSIGDTVRVVLSGFGFHYIADDVPAGVPDRVDHLTDIIRWFGNTVDDPVAAEETPTFRNSLAQNYPNPFNPVTTIRYSIAQPGRVTLKIYNVAGQLVRTLVDEEQRPLVGGYSVKWKGVNNTGGQVSSGVYFYKLETAGYSRARKMVLLQ